MAVPAWASFYQDAPWGHFLNLVSDALQKRGLGHEVDGDAGCVRLADGRTLGLSNLAQMCHRIPWDRWPGLIDHHFGIALRATATGGDEDLVGSFETIRPMLKLRVWHREMAPSAPFVSWDIADDLLAVLTLDQPEMLTTVRRDDAARWPLSRADLWHLALANVRAEGLLRAPALDVGDGAVVHVVEGDRTYFAASHVLFLEAYVGPPTPSGCVVAVPRRHTIVFHRIEDRRVVVAVQSMLQVIPTMCHEGPGSISPSLYWWQPGHALMRLPAQVVGNTLEFYPPPPFAEMLNRLPPRT